VHARKMGKKEVLRETSRIAGEKIENLSEIYAQMV
jgi:hypothetical protein